MSSKQEQRLAVSNAMDTLIFNFGTAKPEDKIPFEFNYSGDIPIAGVKPQCGCTDLKVDGNKITGILSLSNAVHYNTQPAQYIEDAQGVFWTIAGKWATPSDPRLQKVPATEIQGKKVPQERKSFTVVFDDGEDSETVDENKVIRANQNKLTLSLSIIGYIAL